MSEELKVGFKVKTIDGRIATVQKRLGGGGQGDVYLIDYNNSPMALKWYKKGIMNNPQAFYENLVDNKEHGAPSAEFLWPVDVTEWIDGTFGYVMPLKPNGFYEVSDFMLTNVRFKSYKIAIDAALKIVSAYRLLHNDGYSYQDLNDGNFFINPQNGKVLICDNDNVAPDKTETGIIGKPRYMAPEIVMKKNMPNSLSDLFSMSVILFILFCMTHPLEGKRSLEPCLSPALQEKLYGSEALFIIFKKSFVEKHFLDIMAKDNTMFDFFFHYIYGIHDNDDYILFQKTEKNKYLIESIIMEYCDKSHMYQQMITGYLIALFAEFARQSEQNKNPLSQAGNRDISDILLFIKQQFTTVTLNQIAKRFNYSPNYLSRLIKSTTGKTFKEIVLDYKLECVKNLLASTNLSIEKISGILNFKDSFYISKLFKKKYGITPSNYRMNITDKTLF